MLNDDDDDDNNNNNSTFRSMCAMPNMAVFCSSFTSCFPGMLLMYFLNDFGVFLLSGPYILKSSRLPF